MNIGKHSLIRKHKTHYSPNVLQVPVLSSGRGPYAYSAANGRRALDNIKESSGTYEAIAVVKIGFNLDINIFGVAH